MDPLEEAAAFDFRALWREDCANCRPRELADYQQRFPGFEARIADEWAAVHAPPPADAMPSGTPEQLGPYRLGRLLGRGGQGSVWLAADTRVQHRVVALKVLDPTAIGRSTMRVARLRREAAALARIDHPGICTMLDVQLDVERPYLAMRFVDGVTLQEQLAATTPPRTTADLHRVLQWLERAALAAHAAHEAGIVHRDIKPANIMLDRDLRPVLLDFGLARDEARESSALTLSGEVFGTLAYMAPEQLLGGLDLDRRIDVYALGVTLYECLTGARPFTATSRETISADIRTGRYPDPRTHNPAIPRDLAVVVAKAMDLARERRYATAREFADDLANVRERRPIGARPASAALRAWRWTQRHPLAASTLCVMAGALLVVSFVLLQLQQQAHALMAWKQASRVMVIAASKPDQALDQAFAATSGEMQPDFRAALHATLAANWQIYGHPAAAPGVENSSVNVAPVLLPGRRTMVGLSNSGALLLWDITDGSLLGLVGTGMAGEASALALTGDGAHLVSAYYDGRVLVRDAHRLLADHAAPTVLDDDARPATCLLADGERGFYVGGMNGRLQHCPDPGGPLARQLLDLGDEWVRDLWLRPDRTALLVRTQLRATDREHHTLRLIDLRTAIAMQSWSFAAPDLQAEWSPDGSTFAIAAGSGVLQLCRADGASIWRKDSGKLLNAAHFRPDGRQLATFGADGLLVRDPATGDELLRRQVATGRPFENGWFAPTGDRVAVAVRDGTFQVYDTEQWQLQRYLGHTHLGHARWALWGIDDHLAMMDHSHLLGYLAGHRPFLPELTGHRANIVGIALHPDGRHLVSADGARVVRWSDLQTGVCQRQITCTADPTRVCAAASGTLVVTAEPVAQLWPWDANEPIQLRGHTDIVADGQFLADGARVLTIGADGTARLWSATDGALQRSIACQLGPLRHAAVDEAAGLLAVSGVAPRVRVFSLATGEPVGDVSSQTPENDRLIGGEPTCLAFDAVNHRLYAAAMDMSSVVSWDLANDWARCVLNGVGSGSTGWAVPDPRGRCVIATENSIGNTRWFDARSSAPLPWDPDWQPDTKITRVAFRGDGTIALLASLDGTVRLLDIDRRQPWSVLRSNHGGATDACFSADGNQVAVGYFDGAVVVWPVDPYPVAAVHRVRRK